MTGAMSEPILNGTNVSGIGILEVLTAIVMNRFPGGDIHFRPLVPLPLNCSLDTTANISNNVLLEINLA